MISAIIYKSNTGYTERYAKMLGEKLSLPVYPLGSAPTKKGGEIIYMGWVMASGVSGLKKAMGKYKVKAVCGVCMGESGSQLEELRKANALAGDMPLFTLQGGFDMKKLRGVYRLMMEVMAKTLGKALRDKPDRTAEEDDMLDMLLHGGDRVSEDKLAPVLDWYDGRK